MGLWFSLPSLCSICSGSWQRIFIFNNRTIVVQNRNIWIPWSQYSRYLIISGEYQYYYYCVLSCLNMIVRLWGWRWSSQGHLSSIVIDIVCHPACPALSWHNKQHFKYIEFTINYPGLAQIIFYMCRFVYSGMLTFTFAFGKSTEFLVGNLKWLPIILTHLARSSTDFSALF